MPIEIERAFAEANPGLRPEMMAVSCGRRVFQEIRICLDRDLRNFRQCPEVDRERLPRRRNRRSGGPIAR